MTNDANASRHGHRLVAVHQPNFFPWLGYFDKARRADVFVVLDNCQFAKKGGTWSNRVRLMVGGKAAWCTVPVERNFSGVRLVCDIRIHDELPWREKMLATVRASYGRSPFYADVMPWLEELIRFPSCQLSEYNLNAVRFLMNLLRIDTSKLVIGSTLGVTGAATELLINIVGAVGGDRYLAGGGAEGYQDDAMFAEHGIGLVYQSFDHPTYQQHRSTDFMPGLSIIDALMNCGVDGTRQMLTQAHQRQTKGALSVGG